VGVILLVVNRMLNCEVEDIPSILYMKYIKVPKVYLNNDFIVIVQRSVSQFNLYTKNI
jgi:hypothetical protein